MREESNNCPLRLVSHTRNLLTCPSAEQTIERKDRAPSSRQGEFGTPQERACRHTLSPEGKRKKCRIPFVVLALLLDILCNIV
jgi:hypothetical protein